LHGARRRGLLAPQILHAAKVALAASLLVGVVYAGCAAVLDWVVSVRLTHSAESRMSDLISDVPTRSPALGIRDEDDGTPVYVWLERGHRIAGLPVPGAPRLPRGFDLEPGRSATVQLPQGSYLVTARAVHGDVVIAGQSLQGIDHIRTMLLVGEAVAAPFLLLAMFAGALIVGLRALSPVEQARRRQLEFTADASHELRTPLSVISAETALVLSAPRRPAEYRAALARIDREGDRLRKIVEDLLWLARFDSAPPQPEHEPVDLATIAAECGERFSVLGAASEFDVQIRAAGRPPAWISAPSDWIDRLAGVLMDNASRFAGTGGTVRISAAARGSRVTLTIEDSGPGVPAEVRTRMFDRFHRSTEHGGSAGLGLAIADSIVRSTDGQWRLDDSELGGALFEVSWRRAGPRHYAQAERADEGPGAVTVTSSPGPNT
jgi:signal transduction histidine kinase